MKKYNKNIGGYCESLAANYLKKNSYYILDMNFRNVLGELDIICTKHNILIIVEVKGRYTRDFGIPSESVTLSKQKSIIKITKSYILYKHYFNFNIRFDVIEVYLNNIDNSYKINHIKDAFRIS